MSFSKPVCHSCGALLSHTDEYCSQCGAKVESNILEGATKAISDVQEIRRCDVCGHHNTPAANFCESCGAKLRPSVGSASRSGASPSGQQRDVALKRDAKQKRSQKGKATRAWEPWQIIAGAAVLVLVGFLTYNELNRAVPGGPTSLQNQSGAGSAEMNQEIARLQKVVEANPNDAASVLRLANLLHDSALHDAGLLPRAIDMYKRYLAMNPDNPDARVDMGICYFELGRSDTLHSTQFLMTAKQEMEAAYNSHPTHQMAAFNLGIVNLHLGNLEASSKWLTRAIELDGNSSVGVRAKQILEQHAFQPSPN